MDMVENIVTTARELESYAQRQGSSLDPLRRELIFENDRRWIFLWRKRAGLPASGRAEEQEGTLHYNLQGAIAGLPARMKGSKESFQGAWSEHGTLDDIGQAFTLVSAWLLERAEIDELPCRSVRRSGI